MASRTGSDQRPATSVGQSPPFASVARLAEGSRPNCSGYVAQIFGNKDDFQRGKEDPTGKMTHDTRHPGSRSVDQGPSSDGPPCRRATRLAGLALLTAVLLTNGCVYRR